MEGDSHLFQKMTGLEDEAQFVMMVQALLGTDNDARTQAETSYESIAPDRKVLYLLTLLRNPAAPEDLRIMCSVLLRRQLTSNFDAVWNTLNPEGQSQFKQELMTLVGRDNESLGMRKKLAEVTAELVRNLIDDEGNNNWPEFLQYLFQMSNTSNIAQKENALIVFSLVPHMFGNQYSEIIKQMLLQAFQHESRSVKFHSAKALACFITDNEKDESVLRHFSDLAPYYLRAMMESCESDDDALFKMAIEIISVAPKFLRANLGSFLEFFVTAIKDDRLEDDWMHLAIEFIVTAAETVPGAVKKVGGHLFPQFVKSLLEMMADQEQDPDWAASDEEVDEEADCNSAIAETSLDRFACAVGGKTVLPIVIEQVQTLLGSPEWSDRFAGLMAVSAVGEGCSKQMESYLPQIVDPILCFLRDPDPRVQYAACNAVGQMATDFAPGYEKKFHSKILPSLISVLDDNYCARVQAHAGAALVNFCEECPRDILKNYADPLMAKLESCLQLKIQELRTMSKKLVLEQIVTTVAAIANTLEEDFAQFYDRFMPCLKYIMENANSPLLRKLRGKTIECASLVGLAVGAEKFTNDASAIMDLLLRTQVDNGGINLDDDDPQVSYMITAWTRICQILGSSFAPYLSMVMPPILRTASIKPEFTLLDNEEELDGQDDWELISLGNSQNVGLRTSKLEDKAMACQMLVTYARVMKEHFRPYVDEVVKLVVPLLKFYFHDGVRSSAAEILPHLIKSVGNNPADMMALWGLVKTDLLIATEAEPECEVKLEQLHALAMCIELLPPDAFDVPTIQKITSVVEKVFTEHFERCDERTEQRKDEDYDEVIEQQHFDEMEEDNYILTKASDLIQAMLKVHKTSFLTFMEPRIIPYVTKLISPERYYQERQWGICIWDDVMEFTGPESAKYQQLFLPYLLQYLGDSSCEVRQAAAYGCGVMAQFGGAAFAQACSEAVPKLRLIISDPEARSENNISATENAISAVGKIIKFCPQAVNVAEIIPLWLSWLPTWEDKTEINSVYGLFCDLLEENSPYVLGQNGSNLPRVTSIIAESFYRKCFEDKETAPNKARMLNLLRVIQNNPEMFQACVAPLAPELQQSLQVALQTSS